MALQIWIIFAVSFIRYISSSKYFIYHNGKRQCNGWEYLPGISELHVFECTSSHVTSRIEIPVSKQQPYGQPPFKTYGHYIKSATLDKHKVTIFFIQPITSLVHYVYNTKLPPQDLVNKIYGFFFAGDKTITSFVPLLSSMNTHNIFGQVIPIRVDKFNRVIRQSRSIKIFSDPQFLRNPHLDDVFAMNLQLYYAPFNDFDLDYISWSDVYQELQMHGSIPLATTDVWPHIGPITNNKVKWKYNTRNLFVPKTKTKKKYGAYEFENTDGQKLYIYRSKHSPLLVDHIQKTMADSLQGDSVVLIEMTAEKMKTVIMSSGAAGQQVDMRQTFIKAVPRQIILADIEMRQPYILLQTLKHKWWSDTVDTRPLYDFFWILQRNRAMVDMVNKMCQEHSTVRSFWITIGADHYGEFMYPRGKGTKAEILHFLGMKELLETPSLQRPFVTVDSSGFSYLFARPYTTPNKDVVLKKEDVKVDYKDVDPHLFEPIIFAPGTATIDIPPPLAKEQYFDILDDEDRSNLHNYQYNSYYPTSEAQYINNSLILLILLILFCIALCFCMFIIWAIIGFVMLKWMQNKNKRDLVFNQMTV